MKYYTLFFVINVIFGVIYRYIGVDLNILILFILFDFVYLFCIYVWKNQPELYNRIMNNCQSASQKPVILTSHKSTDPYSYYDKYNNSHNNNNINNYNNHNNHNNPTFKRNVSETVKKYVASNQRWTCRHCMKMLDGSYEIDHIIPLYKGGGNGYENLMALCRNCHGRKTMADRLNINSNQSNNKNNNNNPVSLTTNHNSQVKKIIINNK